MGGRGGDAAAIRRMAGCEPRESAMRVTSLCLLLLLTACGPGGLRAGGQYSGFPDTTIGDPQRNYVTGTISTDGVIRSRRDGFLVPPR